MASLEHITGKKRADRAARAAVTYRVHPVSYTVKEMKGENPFIVQAMTESDNAASVYIRALSNGCTVVEIFL
jgi:hypothetical protein